MKKVPFFFNSFIWSKTYLCVLALGLWLGISSCSKFDPQNPELTSVNHTSPITIDEAMAWYARQISNARISSEHISNRMPYWKYAKNERLANGAPFVIVPLLYDLQEPIGIKPGTQFSKNSDGVAQLDFDKKEARIQKKMMISKDDNGNIISCVLSIIPTYESRKKNREVKKERFDGSVFVFDELEKSFLLALKYKNGKLKEIVNSNSNKGARLLYDCIFSLYTWHNQPPARVTTGGGGGNNPNNYVPSQFQDASQGGVWILEWSAPANCGDGDPYGYPSKDLDTPDQAYWFVKNLGGSGGTGGPTPPVDPLAPSVIDEGMPMDLSAVDSFFWMMRNRIGTPIIFTPYEETIIRDYFTWELQGNILDYVDQHNAKPVITLENNQDGEDFISLYGGLEAYIGPDPTVCSECTEMTIPGRPLCAPRSSFPPGGWGDFLYKIDKMLAQSALFPGVGALRAPSAIYNAARFRASLNALKAKPSGVYDAHHIFPQKFNSFFLSKGINIHEPRFGVWWSARNHRQNAYNYNQAWQTFIQNNPNATHQQILDFAKQLMNQYGFDIFWFY